MKRILFIVVCAITLNIAKAQDTLQVDGKMYTAVDTTKLTVKEVYNDAKEGIAGLAKALKAPAEHVYRILVRQQIVSAVGGLLVGLLGAMMILTWFRAYRNPAEKWIGKDGDGDRLPNLIGFVRLFQIIIGVIVFSVFASELGTVLTGIINPEYGAIKDIFQFVRGGKE